MSVSPWHADLALHEEAFACLQDLLTPQSLALTAVKAIREWGQGLLRLSAALAKENDALEGENARLRERITDLKRRAALDSTTSSRPPASDGLAKKSATRKRTRSQRGTSARPSGGQPGHKGTTLAPSANPDHVVDHDPSACGGCGAPLSDADRHGDPVRRQVFDVPEPQPLQVTEHRGHRCLCAVCGTVTTAAFPNGVSAPVQYGSRITAWVTYLSHAQFIPEKRVAEVLSELVAVKLSTATIAAIADAPPGASRASLIVSQRSSAPPSRSNTSTRPASASPCRPVGSMSSAPPWLTILRIATGRRPFDETLNGIVIHDDYTAYFALGGVRHGACNAHHLRELQALIEIEKEDWAASTHRLLIRAHRAARFARENDREVPASLVARIAQAWDRILNRAIAAHEAKPPLPSAKRGRKKRRIGHNLALRLHKHKEGCLRFLTDLRTPFTNNEGERDLRMGKLRQKISGGFRSMRGAFDFSNLRSVIATARKQGWNVLDTLAHPDPIQLIPKLRF